MRNLKFLCLAVIAILTSCQQESQLVNSNDKKTKENIVNSETAQNVAFFYLHKNKNVPNTRSRQAEEVKIKNTFSINDENEEPIIHVINYEGGGFAVISGDNRIEPMLAYADEGTFGDNELYYPKGLKTWINRIKSTINYIRKNNVELPEELAEHWEITASYGKSRVIPEQDLDCEQGEIFDDFIVGPLLSTTWHQDYPFNMSTPYISCGGSFVRAYVGCVPLAIAQMLKYWEYPTNYDWSSMSNTTGGITTSNLIGDILNHYDDYTDIEYGCDGTGTSGAYIDDVLVSDFGYKSATFRGYDQNLLQYDLLSNARPAILIGSSNSAGHAWICDGAHRWNVCLGEEASGIAAGYLHFHMNWGWGGSYDGWFSEGNYSIPNSGTNYNSDMSMVYNIKPY